MRRTNSQQFSLISLFFAFVLFSTAYASVQTDAILAAENLEQLRDTLDQNTRYLPKELGKSKASEEECLAAQKIFDTSEKILSEDISDEFRIWTLKRRVIALVILAYEDSSRFFPILSQEIETLDDYPECEKVGRFAEEHVLKIASVLAVDSSVANDKKNVKIDLKVLTEWIMDFAGRFPGKESDLLIANLLFRIEQLSDAEERNRCLAVVAEPFANHFIISGDNVKGQKLLAVARRMKLPGKPMKLNGVDIEGDMFKIDSMLGKVVLVDFWGTWCISCREEMPKLIRLYDKYNSRGFEVLGVNTAVRGDEKTEKVKKFLADTKFNGKTIPWKVIIDDNPTQKNSIRATSYYGIDILPERILIGRDGNVIQVGLTSAELEEGIQKAISYQKVLDEMTDEEKALYDAAKKREDDALKQELEMLEQQQQQQQRQE